MVALLNDEQTGLTPFARETFAELYGQLVELEQRIVRVNQRLDRIFNAHPVCRKPAVVAGIGPLPATALLAAVSRPRVFQNGRHLAAWLGLVPRQCSSGGRTRLGRLSKRGNRYLRTLLIHGARAVVQRAAHKTDARGRWIWDLKRRKGTNVAVVAIANKNARVIWALLAHETCTDNPHRGKNGQSGGMRRTESHHTRSHTEEHNTDYP